MNAMLIQKLCWSIIFSSLSLILIGQYSISGEVKDENGLALIGVNITTSLASGSITDVTGAYELTLNQGQYELTFSYIGYISQVISIKVDKDVQLDVVLTQDILQMEEVLISAPFNEKSKLESSISITTLDQYMSESLAPTSALETLKQVPGIYVNDANGEVGVEIQGRGLGISYFSLQEDGLASSLSEMASNEQFTRDMFLRNDIMVQRVEAIRGGSSGISTANSPGGIFNYISRQGGSEFGLEFRNRFGLHANGREAYNKLELMLAGPVQGTDWHYAIGGHYRYDGGNRPSFFPHSQGGQLKANVTRVINNKLSIKLYAKYLDDRVGLNRPTLVQNWNNIRPAGGFDWADNVILPDATFEIGDGLNSTNDVAKRKQIATRDQQKVDELTGGINLTYVLNKNWKLNSKTRLSKKELTVNHLAEEGGFSTIQVDGLFARLFSNFNWIVPTSESNEVYRNMVLGEMEFYDINTNEVLATVDNTPLLRGNSPAVVNNNLPGNGEVFWGLVDNDELGITEIVQQLSLTGKYDKHYVTLGGYYHRAYNDRVLNSASSFLTIEAVPRLLGTRVRLADFSDIADFVPELQPLVPFAGEQVQFANSTGLHGYNSQVNEYNQLSETIYSLFANDEWTITDQLNLDGGVRYEWLKHHGQSGVTAESDIEANPGGTDGDLLTVYDNGYNFFSGRYLAIDKRYSTFSFSIGANYKLSDRTAVYGRYSRSEKLVDAIYQQDMFVGAEPQTFIPREISQAEVGVKYSSNRLGLFGLVYRSVEQNIFNQLFVICISCDGGFYLTEPLFNSVQHIGAELEVNFYLMRWWSIRSILNISGGTNREFNIVNTGDREGPEDDIIVDLSGKPVAGSTSSTFDLSPIDITNRFALFNNRAELMINYRRFAERFANSQQAFTLPSFHLFKLGLSYKLNNAFSASVNINNLFNEIGILRFNGYNAVAGFPENVTQEFIEENPDTWFKVQRSLPRAYYFTINYKL